MHDNRSSAVSLVGLIVGTALLAPAAGQSIFDTRDFRQDRERWTDPAYYHNNTVGEMREMDRAVVYGIEGTGRVGAADLASPYPYDSASAHYQAWLDAAGGGTRHTWETLPDWRGRYFGGGDELIGGPNPASSVVPLLTPPYQAYFVQDMWALATGRNWGANAFCLPGGFVTAVRDAEEFVATPDRVWILGAGNNRELHPLDLHRRQRALGPTPIGIPSGTGSPSASGTATHW